MCGEANMLIKVRESAHKAFLDSDKVAADVKDHLGLWIDMIREVTDYDSNLLPRCFASSERSLKDAVILPILLRQVVAMLDGIEILLSQGAPHAAQLQMRALFEASVYIDWVLLGDSEKKAAYYYVHNLRRKRVWASRTQPGSPESEEFIVMMDKSGVPMSDKLRESSAQQIKDIDRVLSEPRFAEISSDFDKHRKGRKFDPAWYVPLGERSLGTMARTVGKASLFVMLYSGASDVMHASSYEHHIKVGKGELFFEPIRSIEGFEHVWRFSVIVAFKTYRRILKQYREEELVAFSRKYVENWQREFLNFPKISYET